MRVRLLRSVLIVLACACGQPQLHLDGGVTERRCIDQPLPFRGRLGSPRRERVVGNVFLATALANGVPSGPLVVDTGAPQTLMRPSIDQHLEACFQTAALDAVGLTFTDAPVYGTPLSISIRGEEIAGLLGGDVLCHFELSLNYRDQELTVGEPQPVGDVEPARTQPFVLQGGGYVPKTVGTPPEQTEYIRIDPTRIVVPVVIEGEQYFFLIDTGARLSIVSPALFQKVTADGRQQLPGPTLSGVLGQTQSSVTRLSSVSVAGAEVKSLAVVTIDGAILNDLSKEVNRQIDGLLGGNFFRSFVFTVDYPRQSLRLERYVSQAHVQDEYHRVGVFVREQPGSTLYPYLISTVAKESHAAAQRILVGEPLTAIDGEQLGGRSPLEVDEMLRGAIGQTKVLTVDKREVSVLVEDVLPLK